MKRILLVAGLVVLVAWIASPPTLRADVLILQDDSVLIGKILQRDGSGVLFQSETGTWRYPSGTFKEARKEAVTKPNISNNGQAIPDWAQIVTLLGENAWAEGVQQVPATVINYGSFKNIPYVSFRCASGGYELNIFGNLDAPVAVQFGAVGYLKDNPAARTNCVNLVSAVLANPALVKAVQGLDFSEKQVTTLKGFTVQNLIPGEMGSYGGWWVSVQNNDALAKAQASEEEIQNLTAAPAAAQTNATAVPEATTASQNNAGPESATASASAYATTSGGYYYPYWWTRQELGYARPYQSQPPATVQQPTDLVRNPDYTPANNPVYPRVYNYGSGRYTRRLR